ncbi:hypothetical protein L1D44_12995 [Shewanella sp. Isolate13]|uniref:hypothetical protein n=1 Tax=Shewanella sp. Isolate13 TaxID=2908531 RepID=UPI001EFC8F00|nr:hypothetical protein [Shewanella sp. Isolate13]MCG9730751.1 hypothetical protein [Shewanella sp. Isolate13]
MGSAKVLLYLGKPHRFVFASTLGLVCLSNMMIQHANTSPDEIGSGIAEISLPSAQLGSIVDVLTSSLLLAKSRYHAGLVCQEKGWEFCARWAQSRRSPRSRIA